MPPTPPDPCRPPPHARASRRRRGPGRGALTLLVALLGSPGLGPGAREARAEAAAPLERALDAIDSPLQGAREGAEAWLAAALTGPEAGAARARIAARLPEAPWAVQVALAEVLARDESPESLDLLLAHLTRAPTSQYGLIAMALLRDPQTGTRLLDAWRTRPEAFAGRDRPAEQRARLAELGELLRRLEIERLFVARKSPSGGTGYYRGQYEELARAGRREPALRVVLGIALDEALPMPGHFVSGGYQFLQPVRVEIAELRDMAINAVAELATPGDEEAVARLERRRGQLEEEWQRRYEWLLAHRSDYWESDERAKRWEDRHALWEDVVGEYADVVACLYLVVGGPYERHVRAFLDRMDEFLWDRTAPRPIMTQALKSSVLIRVGWYREAIQAYQASLRSAMSSRVLAYYNMACAYANWSLQEDAEATGLGEVRRNQALSMLEESVRLGWTDLDWMRQDRDLDPLRDSPRYRALEQVVRERLFLPPEPGAAPGGGDIGDPDGR